ncbi:MAG: hypothetical protein S4CHLAM6_15810 [Chlamydiae bacterium]|nr:hypothetical protein [Chlamydiota bacterium]
MIIAYTVLFLTLFGLVGNVFIQKYKNFKINDLYFEQFYQPYVHRSSKINVYGFNLRKLNNGDASHKEIFCNFVKHVYEKASFYYEGIENDLLEVFKEQVVFDASKVDKGRRVYVSELSNLSNLNPKKKLYDAYFYLMNSNRINEEGFPPLTNFIHPDITPQDTLFNLYNTPKEIIEVIFSDAVANDLEISLKKFNSNKNKSQADKDCFLKDFITRNRLQHHPNRDLVNFKVPHYQ